MTRPKYQSRGGNTPWKPLALLLACSGVLVVLPTTLTGRMNNLSQLLAPFQAAAAGAANLIDPISGDEDTDTEIERRLRALRSIVASLSAQNRALRRENEALAGIRGRGLGTRGRLIPAKVIAHDSVYWRKSSRLLAGTRRGVTAGHGVISHHFSVDLSEADGVANGMAVLSAEVLVGIIAQTGAYTSQVRLLNDPETRMSITIGRVEGTTFNTTGAAFWLVGKGNRGIEIRDVHHQYITDQTIKIGDIVLTRPDESLLPSSVTIGTITGMTPDPDNRLLYNLQVDPGIDISELRRVFVVDTGR